DDDIRQLSLPLVLELAHPLEPADASEKLPNVMPPPPFAVADAVDPGLFLKADGEDDHLVHQLVEAVRLHLRPSRQQIQQHLRPRQRADHLREERGQSSCSLGFHRGDSTTVAKSITLSSPCSMNPMSLRPSGRSIRRFRRRKSSTSSARTR